MNPYVEKWGIEAYSVDGDANINRVYFTGESWSKNTTDMHAFTEAESIIIKRVFERQGLNLNMHKMTRNNPAPDAMSIMPTRNSRLYAEQQGWS